MAWFELGFSADEAQRFENELGEMGVLVYIALRGKGFNTRAVEMMQLTGAYEAASLESTLPVPGGQTDSANAPAGAVENHARSGSLSAGERAVLGNPGLSAMLALDSPLGAEPRDLPTVKTLEVIR